MRYYRSMTEKSQQKTTPRVLAVIPCYNEQDSVASLAQELAATAPTTDYIFINDGSSDATEQVLSQEGISHLTLPCNLGLDGAFRTGVLYASAHGYDYVVQIDGDGQHVPIFIDKLIETSEKTQADIVIGSRFAEKKKPFSARMLGSAFISAMIKITTGKTIKDPTSGMRLYNKKIIARMARFQDLTPEPDSIVLLMRSGAKVCETQVDMRERETGESYLTIKRSIAYMLRVGVSILFVQWFQKKE